MGDSDLSTKVKSQFEALKSIPEAVLCRWPAWFTFGVVRIVERLLISVIPPLPGMAGDLVNFAVRGMIQTTNHVAWKQIEDASMMCQVK